MKVLVTRPPGQAAETELMLERMGHGAIVSPLFRIEPTEATLPSGPFDDVVGASANAFGCLSSGAVASVRALPLHVVGHRTAEAAKQAGFTSIIHVAPTADELAAHLAEAVKGRRVLYLAGLERKPAIEHCLARVALSYAVAETYRTVAAGGFSPAALDAMRRGEIDAVLHFSRRSAELFCRLVALHGLQNAVRRMSHFCLSEDVAKGLKGLGDLSPAQVAWPAQPRMPDLLALLDPSEH